jgi:hypothetical protein
MQKDLRYLDIREDDELDEAQLAAWTKQAATLPGFLGPRSQAGTLLDYLSFFSSDFGRGSSAGFT